MHANTPTVLFDVPFLSNPTIIGINSNQHTLESMLNMFIISLYDKFGRISEGSEDIATDGTKKFPSAIISRSVDAFSREKLHKYPHIAYITRN